MKTALNTTFNMWLTRFSAKCLFVTTVAAWALSETPRIYYRRRWSRCVWEFMRARCLRGDRKDLVGSVLHMGGEATSSGQTVVPTEDQTEVTLSFRFAMCSSFVVLVTFFGSMRLQLCLASSTGTLFYNSSISARDLTLLYHDQVACCNSWQSRTFQPWLPKPYWSKGPFDVRFALNPAHGERVPTASCGTWSHIWNVGHPSCSIVPQISWLSTMHCLYYVAAVWCRLLVLHDYSLPFFSSVSCPLNFDFEIMNSTIWSSALVTVHLILDVLGTFWIVRLQRSLE